MDESTETAGTTKLWKTNAGDSPDAPKKKKESTDDEEKSTPEKEAKEDMKAADKAVAKAEKAEKEDKAETAEKEDKAEKKAAAKESAKEDKEETSTKKKSKSKEPEEESAAKKKPKAKTETDDAPESKSFIQTESTTSCEPAIDVSQKQLDIELDYFSRSFNPKNYKKAMQVYKELKKQGKDPKVSIHTWELYDAAFSFQRVRRYDLVQKHMDLLQHFQDNLNENFSNKLHLDNFMRIANNARSALNTKYHNGEFSDPADFDPEADHPTTWENAVIWDSEINTKCEVKAFKGLSSNLF